MLDLRIGGRQPANTPRWKGTLGASYAGARTDVNVSARRVTEFLWSTGVWVGKVPSSTSVHVAGGYRVNSRLRLHGVVTNLFDQERFHSYGGAVIGRRAMVGVTADF